MTGELLKAVMIDRSINARWKIYTADSIQPTGINVDPSTGLNITVQQQTYFLVQKVMVAGFYPQFGSGQLTQQLPDYFIGNMDIFDPKSGKSYMSPPYSTSGTGGVFNMFFPPVFNNTADLESYILLKGSDMLGVRLNVIAPSQGPGGIWFRFMAAFSGVEFTSSQPLDIAHIKTMAIEYMPPNAAQKKIIGPGDKTGPTKNLNVTSSDTPGLQAQLTALKAKYSQLAGGNVTIVQAINNQKAKGIKNDPVLADLNAQHTNVTNQMTAVRDQITLVQAKLTAANATGD